MKNKSGRVYTIEYETIDMSWKANIIALSRNDAMNVLNSKVKKKFRILSISSLYEIDAYSSDIINTVKSMYPINNPQEEKIIWRCPWCEFETEKRDGLKIHIGRNHKNDK